VASVNATGSDLLTVSLAVPASTNPGDYTLELFQMSTTTGGNETKLSSRPVKVLDLKPQTPGPKYSR
jgi:hypothetical protein